MDFSEKDLESIIIIQRRIRNRYCNRVIFGDLRVSSRHGLNTMRSWISRIPVSELLSDPERYRSILTAEKIKRFGAARRVIVDSEAEFDKDHEVWDKPVWLKNMQTLKNNNIEMF